METELPILSVRKMVKNDHDVVFEDHGGSIRNRKTGKTIRLFEHEGVYFVKFKVKDPDSVNTIVGNNQGFHRQGA